MEIIQHHNNNFISNIIIKEKYFILFKFLNIEENKKWGSQC